jgi:hypothetical protein
MKTDKDRVRFLLETLNKIHIDKDYPADIKDDLTKTLSSCIRRYAKARKMAKSFLSNLEIEVVYGVKI